MENQRAYQGLFGSDGAPFVAGIYSTIESERFALFVIGDNDCAGMGWRLIRLGGLKYDAGDTVDIEKVFEGVEQCMNGDDRKSFDEDGCRRIREAWPTGDSGVEEFIKKLQKMLKI